MNPLAAYPKYIPFLGSCIAALLFSSGLFAQIPSIARWMQNATEIKPGLWMGNCEVAVRDYAFFEHYVNRDSGEVLFNRFAPEPEFRRLGYVNRDGDHFFDPRWWTYFIFPVEADHPMVGIDHDGALGFCTWLTAFCNQVEFGYWYDRDTARLRHLPLVRFRLPSPEEWQLAAGQATSPKPNAAYRERPSRYLHTRTVSSARPGEKGLLHFHDNVSEMTSDSGVVLGGNFEADGLQQAHLPAQVPDLRLGFRIVMEYVDQVPEKPELSPPSYTKQFEVYDLPQPDHAKRHPQGLKSEYYPFDLKKRCFEVEPDIWISRHPVTIGEYAYHLFYTRMDSGEAYTRSQFPAPCRPPKPSSSDFYTWESTKRLLPPYKRRSITGLTPPQIRRFCDWMTRFNAFSAIYPRTGIRYLFRPPTAEEWEKARAHPRYGNDLQAGPGFHYVVERMPIHPDIRHLKAIPLWQADRQAYVIKKYLAQPWPGFP